MKEGGGFFLEWAGSGAAERKEAGLLFALPLRDDAYRLQVLFHAADARATIKDMSSLGVPVKIPPFCSVVAANAVHRTLSAISQWVEFVLARSRLFRALRSAPFLKASCRSAETSAVIVLSKDPHFKFVLVWNLSLVSRNENEIFVESEAHLQPCIDCEFEDADYAARVLATIPDLFAVLAQRFGAYKALELIFARLK